MTFRVVGVGCIRTTRGRITNATERPRSPKRLTRVGRTPDLATGSCLGLMSLRCAYSAERLDAACRLALDIGIRRYKSVKSIVATGHDLAAARATRSSSCSSNARGRKASSAQRRCVRLRGQVKLHLDAAVEDLGLRQPLPKPAAARS